MKKLTTQLSTHEARASLTEAQKDLGVEDPAAEAAHELLKEAFDDRTSDADEAESVRGDDAQDS